MAIVAGKVRNFECREEMLRSSWKLIDSEITMVIRMQGDHTEHYGRLVSKLPHVWRKVSKTKAVRWWLFRR